MGLLPDGWPPKSTLVVWTAAFVVGAGLMLAAGVAGETDDGAMGMLVIGANVAFFSMALATRCFEWGGPKSTVNLRWCHGALLLGYALVLCAAYLGFTSVFFWAMICVTLGLYLLIFGHHVYRQILPGWGQALVFLSGVAQLLGGMFLAIGFMQWPMYQLTRDGPQEITATDLAARGWGENRYVRLTEFRACERGKVAQEKVEEPAPVPARIQVVVYDFLRVNDDEPYEGIVLNGLDARGRPDSGAPADGPQ